MSTNPAFNEPVMNIYTKSIIKALHVGNVMCTVVLVNELVMLKEQRFLSLQIFSPLVFISRAFWKSPELFWSSGEFLHKN